MITHFGGIMHLPALTKSPPSCIADDQLNFPGLVERKFSRKAFLSILSSILPFPTGYGNRVQEVPERMIPKPCSGAAMVGPRAGRCTNRYVDRVTPERRNDCGFRRPEIQCPARFTQVPAEGRRFASLNLWRAPPHQGLSHQGQMFPSARPLISRMRAPGFCGWDGNGRRRNRCRPGLYCARRQRRLIRFSGLDEMPCREGRPGCEAAWVNDSCRPPLQALN